MTVPSLGLFTSRISVALALDNELTPPSTVFSSKVSKVSQLRAFIERHFDFADHGGIGAEAGIENEGE